MADTDAKSLIKIKTNDGKEYQTSQRIVFESITLKELCEDLENDNEPIPLSEVTSHTYELVVKFTDKLLNLGELDKDSDNYRQSNEEIRNELHEMDLGKIHDLINTCDFLNNDKLLHKCCENVADRIKGKSPEEIREILGMEDDLTNEEKEKIKKENEWLLESE